MHFQRVLLYSSYWLFRVIGRKNNKRISWVVGVDEVAANIKYIAQSLNNSYSVCLTKNKFYDFKYDFSIGSGYSTRMDFYKKILTGPILLGYLLNRANNFFYIFSTGFLLSDKDKRKFEFKLIKSKGKHIVCFFIGDDIRSPKLMLEFAKSHNVEVLSSYEFIARPQKLSDAYEASQRKLAEVTDAYADLIFNAATDQMAYFTKKTQPFIYFYPDENFIKNDAKFANLQSIKILHAPSSPILKGTQLIGAAITRLRVEGYKFEYRELIDVSNAVVLQELRSTHIVLNEFYAFVPGLFGIEAMASHCALMTSADEFIEKDLPSGSNQAWYVTKSYEIYDHLKRLLDAPALIKQYADAGYAWAYENAAIINSGKKLSALLACFDE
jgi:hypothetical protein